MSELSPIVKFKLQRVWKLEKTPPTIEYKHHATRIVSEPSVLMESETLAKPKTVTG